MLSRVTSSSRVGSEPRASNALVRVTVSKFLKMKSRQYFFSSPACDTAVMTAQTSTSGGERGAYL